MDMGHSSRRGFIAGASLSTLTLLASSLVRPRLVLAADDTVELQLNWIPSADFSGFYIADGLGYYREEGIKVNFLPGGPNMQAVEQVIAGGTASAGLPTFLTSTINAVQKKARLTVIGAVFQTSPLALISLEDTPLRSAKDLVGKKIGAAQGRQRELDAVFKINNLPPGGYQFVPIGYDPTPLAKRQVDIISVFATSEPLNLADQGIKTNMILYADLGLPTYTDPIVVSNDVLKNNRATIAGFLRASIKGWEMNVKDKTLGIKFLAEKYAGNTKVDVPYERRVNEALIPLTQSELTKKKGMLWIDKEKIAGPIYAGLTAAGETDLPPVDSYVDTTVLQEVYGDKTSLL